ncbi:helix-turn-helix domain-containing protein [Candidatus Shapirobacteria bacterium]|nr:helix-turn-helix domain-containing protein [Candidatus Shapirobacteria bacterium]
MKRKEKWRNFFKEWKKIWRNPQIKPITKVLLFDVFLYRSDGEGWCLSERKLADDLGVGKETVSRAISEAIKKGWLLTNNTKERKRRKLRLSGFLRSPSWVSTKPNIWVSTKPSKYQREYQNNNSFKDETREGKMTKVLTPEELSRRIGEFRGENNYLWRRKSSLIKKEGGDKK